MGAEGAVAVHIRHLREKIEIDPSNPRYLKVVWGQGVPKIKGFKSIHVKAEVVYTDRLNDLKGKVDNYTLAEAGLISTPFAKVKVITRGELTAKIDLSTQFASKTAIEAIKKAGGSFKKVAILKKPAKKAE